MQKCSNKLFTVDFFYTLYFIGMTFLIISDRSIIDLGYFIVITYYYIKLKIHNKKYI